MKPGRSINDAIETISSYVRIATIKEQVRSVLSLTERFWDPAVEENKIEGR